MKNCPNCGAPFGYSNVCEYCGTSKDVLKIQEGSPVRIEYEKDGILYSFLLQVSSFHLNSIMDSYTYHADDVVYRQFDTFQGYSVDVSGRIIKDENGAFVAVKIPQ